MALHHHVESGKEPELPLNPLVFAPDTPSRCRAFASPRARSRRTSPRASCATSWSSTATRG